MTGAAAGPGPRSRSDPVGWVAPRLVIGLLWAGALVWLGLLGQKRGVAVGWLCPLAAGEYVVMWLVLDELCQDASAWFRGFAKLTAAMLVVLAGCVWVWRLAGPWFWD